MKTQAIARPRVEILVKERVTCYDPAHCHRSPVQHTITARINDHIVELTNDGGLFNLRIDEGSARFNLKIERVMHYIMRIL